MGTLLIASPDLAAEDGHRDGVPLGDGDGPEVEELAGGREAQVLAVGGEEQERHLVGLGPERARHVLHHPLAHVEEEIARALRLRAAVRHGGEDGEEIVHEFSAGVPAGLIITSTAPMSRAYDAFAGTRGPCVLLESTAAPSPARPAQPPRAQPARGPGRRRVRPAASHRRRGRRAWAETRSRRCARCSARSARGSGPTRAGSRARCPTTRRGRGAGPPTPKLIALAVDRFLVEEPGAVAGRRRRWRAVSVGGRARARRAGHAAESPPSAPLDLARWSNLTRDEHARLVRVVQEHIAAGDIYQANLSQRFELPWSAGGLEPVRGAAEDQPGAVRRLPARGRAGDRVRVAGAAAERRRRPRDHAPAGRHAPALRRPPRRPRARRRAAAEREGAGRAPDAGGPRPQRPRPGGGHRQRATSTS